jgi:16S rRNA (guanine(527)-N(7))-methyltransferase RsmG
MSDFKESLVNVFSEKGFDLTEEQIEKFGHYYSLLLEWNMKINLTAITDDEGIITKHFLDSAMLCKYWDAPHGVSLADIGSGAGFPAVPLKILRPDIKITLVDSLNKRVLFLQSLLQKLSLEGEALHFRAEEAARMDLYREKFDIVVSRAVARLAVLCEYCLPFVKLGGVFAAFKGFGIDQELKESEKSMAILGAKLERLEKFSLSETETRSLIFVKKISRTSLKYPRQSGKILKSPLL